MLDTLLIIEDEPLLGSELSHYFQRLGWEVILAATAKDARKALLDNTVDPTVVLSDMNLPDGNAMDLLEEARNQNLICEWIFLTAYGSVPDSVRALRLGAYDFLEKPCELERLNLVVAGAARSRRAQQQWQDQAAVKARQYPPDSFVGQSSVAQQVRDMLSRLASVPFSGLILSGETGTGKGLVARILHHSGKRGDGPLIEVNCAALPHDLMESELFGYEAGAFTGAKGRRRGLLEQADGGTLFLDEIGELDLSLQAKLLTAIEDRTIRRLGGERNIKVDVQIIAATNRDLAAQAQAGEFRHDLYHRLSAFQLKLPALKTRKEDLYDLVPQFIAEFNAKANKTVRNVNDEVWQRLHAYGWPGNVRELRNVVERCVLMSEGDSFPVQWLQLGSTQATEVRTIVHHDSESLLIPLDGSMALDEMECHIIKQALEKSGFNVTATARALGTTRETLRYRVRKYGLKGC